MKTITELRKMDIKALNKEIRSLEHNLFRIKFDVNNQETKNTHLVSANRKQIARAKTILREKQLEELKELEQVKLTPTTETVEDKPVETPA